MVIGWPNWTRRILPSLSGSLHCSIYMYDATIHSHQSVAADTIDNDVMVQGAAAADA